jgi:AcrR family transcriptional regulator
MPQSVLNRATKPPSPASKRAPARIRKAAAPPRTYHHGDLRAALVEAALQLLEEKGVTGFTLRECARRADVSHGAPAHHFGDARGLLTACAAEGFRRMSALMAQFREKAGTDGPQRSRANGLGYVAFAVRHRALFQLMFRSDSVNPADPELSAAAQASFGVLESGVRGEAAGPAPPANLPPDVLDGMLLRWAAVHGLATLILEGQLDDFRGDVPMEPFALAVAERTLSQLRKS